MVARHLCTRQRAGNFWPAIFLMTCSHQHVSTSKSADHQNLPIRGGGEQSAETGAVTKQSAASMRARVVHLKAERWVGRQMWRAPPSYPKAATLTSLARRGHTFRCAAHSKRAGQSAKPGAAGHLHQPARRAAHRWKALEAADTGPLGPVASGVKGVRGSRLSAFCVGFLSVQGFLLMGISTVFTR